MARAAMKREAATSGATAEAAERPWLWRPGQSGNPAGRPKGARNKSTLLVEALFEEAAEELVQAAVQRARAGDKAMLRFCLSRLLPQARHRCVEFELPDTSGMSPARAAAVALGAVLKGVAAGEIAPAEARSIAALVERLRRLEEDVSKDAESRPAEPARDAASKAEPAPSLGSTPSPSVFSSVLAAPARPAPARRRDALLDGTASFASLLAGGKAAPAARRGMASRTAGLAVAV
jgi:hypothetical protein